MNWRVIGRGNDVGTFLRGKGEHWFLPAWLTCATEPNDKVVRRVELALVANDIAEAFNGGSSSCHLGTNEHIAPIDSFA